MITGRNEVVKCSNQFKLSSEKEGVGGETNVRILQKPGLCAVRKQNWLSCKDVKCIQSFSSF